MNNQHRYKGRFSQELISDMTDLKSNTPFKPANLIELIILKS